MNVLAPHFLVIHLLDALKLSLGRYLMIVAWTVVLTDRSLQDSLYQGPVVAVLLCSIMNGASRRHSLGPCRSLRTSKLWTYRRVGAAQEVRGTQRSVIMSFGEAKVERASPERPFPAGGTITDLGGSSIYPASPPHSLPTPFPLSRKSVARKSGAD